VVPHHSVPDRSGLIKTIQGNRFQIGNNRGRINGWVSASAIFGRCVKVEA
jgi:hypothetical protein